tara:strand:- start:7323 stop:8267 length:945 start_codon:yes stop_codon:yes gene_type:complete
MSRTGETSWSAARLAGAAAFAAMLAFTGRAAIAQAPQPVDYSDVEASPAIWEISDEDSQIYLLGTFHILPASLDWQSDAMLADLRAADSLYLEADVHSPEAEARVQAMVVQMGLNPAGVTLTSMLDAETAALLAEVAPTVGATPAMLDPMRPWLAEIVLAVAQMQALGLDPTAGVEQSLLAAVQGTSVEMGYFETAEDQMNAIAGQPEEIQLKSLAEGLREMERMPDMLDQMVRAWATGDVETIDSLINSEMREDAPEVYEALIVQRNRNWMPQILALLDGEGTVFIAVGAAHLTGDDGVIAQLRAAGVEVTRQ